MTKKIKFNVPGAENAESEGFGGFYDGPVPPKGVYKTRLKWMKLKTNKNGDPMLNGIVEIEEKGDKAKFNGYGIFFNQNVTQQGAPYVNQFLDAMGFNKKTFWSTGVVLDENDADESKKVLGTVTKIGTKAAEGILCKVNTKRSTYNDEPKLDITRWLPAGSTTDEEDEEADAWADATEEEEEAEEVEEEEAEEEEDAEDEEEEDDDLWSAAQIEELTRAEKVALAKQFELKPLKKHSDNDLVAMILKAQEAAGESGEEEEEEDGEPPF